MHPIICPFGPFLFGLIFSLFFSLVLPCERNRVCRGRSFVRVSYLLLKLAFNAQYTLRTTKLLNFETFYFFLFFLFILELLSPTTQFCSFIVGRTCRKLISLDSCPWVSRRKYPFFFFFFSSSRFNNQRRVWGSHIFVSLHVGWWLDLWGINAWIHESLLFYQKIKNNKKRIFMTHEIRWQVICTLIDKLLLCKILVACKSW